MLESYLYLIVTAVLQICPILATAIPIAGLILYTFTTTYKNITKSLEKTIEESDFSDFLLTFK